MSAPHTPGPWSAEADPLCGQDYAVLIALPGQTDTWIARAYHNWQEAEAGERRISWAEAEANARLMAQSPVMLALLEELIDIEGPCPGNASWAAKVLATIAKARGAA